MASFPRPARPGNVRRARRRPRRCRPGQARHGRWSEEAAHEQAAVANEAAGQSVRGQIARTTPRGVRWYRRRGRAVTVAKRRGPARVRDRRRRCAGGTRGVVRAGDRGRSGSPRSRRRWHPDAVRRAPARRRRSGPSRPLGPVPMRSRSAPPRPRHRPPTPPRLLRLPLAQEADTMRNTCTVPAGTRAVARVLHEVHRGASCDGRDRTAFGRSRPIERGIAARGRRDGCRRRVGRCA